ncbi:hypothetical protein KX729_05480 [Rhizobium sp. XQZ8]|uniref:hypothetical protein n=1 Tax=Rhizobium populisoli TaxID=2859785 RepID=UPI001CA5D48B|nr:hypothetical protein [Rhizobium populisoli]MBW6420886.1 hypothetical protein [Rhizobium populisoli]
MKATSAFRVGMGVTGILASVVTLSGCMGPTYGTDKPAFEQLTDDIGASVSMGLDKDEARSNLKYQPRPSLVVATKQQGTALPAPQQSVASRENNPNWVESPEETRARLRKEADQYKNDPSYRSPLLAGNGKAGQMTETQKWQAFRDAKANAENVDVSGGRRTLTEPPSEFRSADANSLTDLGEPEEKKAKRRKQEAVDARSGKSWWQLF